MVQITLTDDQVQRVREAAQETVQLCDSTGKVVAEIPPEYSQEFIAELKRRARSPGPWYTSEQVRAHLLALQEEWDKTGGFDREYMHTFLNRLRENDPGHMRPSGPAPPPCALRSRRRALGTRSRRAICSGALRSSPRPWVRITS